jgi:hypothetical protein
MLVMEITLYTAVDDAFDPTDRPEWYPEAVSYLRGNKDEGLFGLYLYNLIRATESISTVLNIGTARGHSAVCAAKALEETNQTGSVHTIDIIHPDETRDWHASHAQSDPLIGTETSMRELVSRFHDPVSEGTPVNFYTGDSSSTLQQWDAEAPDLVFHDGKHTYETVSADVEAVNGIGDSQPIHVFDDCYLYAPTWELRPFARGISDRLEEIPKVGGLANVLQRFCLSWSPYPGVDQAVEEAMDESFDSAEIIVDNDHAPITTLYPDSIDTSQLRLQGPS